VVASVTHLGEALGQVVVVEAPLPPLPSPGAEPAPSPPGERHGGGSVRLRALGASAREVAASVGRLRHFDAALVAVLVAASLGLHWRTMSTSYWGDEAIAIGIASHPVSQLPHYLVNDGSPPLYYLGLHFWLAVFGRSPVATHALSLVPAALSVPAGWWCGVRLFGRWAGRAAAALVASCAYLDYYSTETRMYSWLVLAAILAVGYFVLALRDGGWGNWAAATVLMTAILYLQYYGLYLFVATVAVGAASCWRRRALSRLGPVLGYAAVCAAAFAPWVPQFVYQLDHTGAPWAPHPSVLDFFGDSFNALASAGWAGVVVAIALAVLAWKGPKRHRQRRSVALASLESSPGARGGVASVAVLPLFTAVPLLTLALAWVAGQVVNSWNPRYLGIAVVPALLALGAGLSRARWRLAALVVAVGSMAATAVPVLVDSSVTVQTAKSDVAYLLAELRGRLHPGALVISAEVTDTPVIALDLGPRYRYATPFGLLADPLVVDWSNLPTRLEGNNAQSALWPLLAAVPAGGQVLLVNPTSWGGSETPERYAGPVEAEGVAANHIVVSDPDLSEEEFLPVPRYSNPLYPMTAVLFVKLGSGGEQ